MYNLFMISIKEINPAEQALAKNNIFPAALVSFEFQPIE